MEEEIECFELSKELQDKLNKVIADFFYENRNSLSERIIVNIVGHTLAVFVSRTVFTLFYDKGGLEICKQFINTVVEGTELILSDIDALSKNVMH